jgi:hypothetical protein
MNWRWGDGVTRRLGDFSLLSFCFVLIVFCHCLNLSSQYRRVSVSPYLRVSHAARPQHPKPLLVPGSS